MEYEGLILQNRINDILEFEKQKTTFLQETETMKKLNHPNLVKMIGICVEKSPLYLVQELCQNGDLKNYLKKYEFVKVHHSMAYMKNRKQSEEEKERYAKVPSLNSLIIWCREIIKGDSASHNIGFYVCTLQGCPTWSPTIWSTETWPLGTSYWTTTSRSQSVLASIVPFILIIARPRLETSD